MTARERVLKSLQHQQPDKIPYQISLTHKARQCINEYLGTTDFEDSLDNSLAWFHPVGHDTVKEIRPNIWQDEFGVQWDRSIDIDIGNVCNQVITPDNYIDFQFPETDDPKRLENFQLVKSKYPDRFILANISFSLFERAWTLAGMEQILMSMVTDPKFVHELLDSILDFNLKVLHPVCKLDIDGVMFGDDWGQQNGLIMGPILWREFIKPRIKTMYQTVKSYNKKVFIHSCGQVEEIFPDLIEVGVDVFNPFQPEVMNVFEVKKRFGNDLAFYGGVSTQQLLPYGTASEVKEQVKILIDKVGKDGGYIIAPAHDVPGDAKPENIMAMLEVFNEQ